VSSWPWLEKADSKNERLAEINEKIINTPHIPKMLDTPAPGIVVRISLINAPLNIRKNKHAITINSYKYAPFSPPKEIDIGNGAAAKIATEKIDLNLIFKSKCS
jgi:hypothetical protein